jgi:hypothetical protein
MPNTTNYSFPTPADTDLVKNGADAIRDLGDAVDTAMNTALGTKKAGMVLLNTTSFSGVASISVNDVFSSTYRVYRILLNVSSGSGSLSIRLRASGADNTSSVYNNAAYFYRSGGAGGDLASDENVNQAYLVDAISNGTFTSMDLYNPNVNSETNGNFTGNHISGSAGYITMSHWGSIRHNTSYQATGFTYIFGSTGTGTVQVYGYNQ